MKLESNRLNKHKDKKSGGCGLCKPHKHGSRAMKDKDRLNLKAREKVETVECGGRMDSVRVRPIRNARGILKGMDTTIEREEDRL